MTRPAATVGGHERARVRGVRTVEVVGWLHLSLPLPPRPTPPHFIFIFPGLHSGRPLQPQADLRPRSLCPVRSHPSDPFLFFFSAPNPRILQHLLRSLQQRPEFQSCFLNHRYIKPYIVHRNPSVVDLRCFLLDGVWIDLDSTIFNALFFLFDMSWYFGNVWVLVASSPPFEWIPFLLLFRSCSFGFWCGFYCAIWQMFISD